MKILYWLLTISSNCLCTLLTLCAFPFAKMISQSTFQVVMFWCGYSSIITTGSMCHHARRQNCMTGESYINMLAYYQFSNHTNDWTFIHGKVYWSCKFDTKIYCLCSSCSCKLSAKWQYCVAKTPGAHSHLQAHIKLTLSQIRLKPSVSKIRPFSPAKMSSLYSRYTWDYLHFSVCKH